jgi:hypothetical protein
MGSFYVDDALLAVEYLCGEVFAAALLRAYDVLEFGRFGGIG